MLFDKPESASQIPYNQRVDVFNHFGPLNDPCLRNSPQLLDTASSMQPMWNSLGDFSVRDLPRVMRFKLNWPKSAEVMQRWFELPARGMTDDEKKFGYPTKLFPASHLDCLILRWQWLQQFARVDRAVNSLMLNLTSPNAKKVLNDRLKRTLGLETRVGDPRPIQINNPADPVELHPYWQFQYDLADYGRGVMDDLYGSLGRFAVFAAVTRAVLMPSGKKSYQLTVSEVGLYVRDTFDFLGNQYLGHWSSEGLGFVGAAITANAGGFEWRLNGYNPNLGWLKPVNNSDFRLFRETYGRGGDLLLFSDVQRRPVNIQMEVNLG